MPGIPELRSLTAVVSADCNLRCAYCYQDAKQPSFMPWRVMRRAIDLLLASSQPTVNLLFSGGEPLLAFPLIRRAVGRVEARGRRAPRVQFHLLTNGTLIGRREARFLADHRFSVQVSFDGTAPAQRLRGVDTFSTLDALLDRLRTEHGPWFQRLLSVNITVLPRTVPFLADSVDYLLSKGVRDIVLTPVQGHEDEWRVGDETQLDAQAGRIARTCRRSLRESGTVPVQLFRKLVSARASRREPPDIVCGMVDSGSLTVDVDGSVSGCVLLARSYQRFPPTRLGRQIRDVPRPALDSGNLRDAFLRSVVQFAASGLFTGRAAKGSSYDRCAACRYRRWCELCPMAIATSGGNEDPGRVPDFACAFSRVLLEHRRRFPVMGRATAPSGRTGSRSRSRAARQPPGRSRS